MKKFQHYKDKHEYPHDPRRTFGYNPDGYVEPQRYDHKKATEEMLDDIVDAINNLTK